MQDGSQTAAHARAMAELLLRIGRKQPLQGVAWLAVPLLLGALVVPGYAAERKLIDTVVGAAAGQDGSSLLRTVWPYLAWLFAIALLRTGLGSLQAVLDVRMRERASRQLQAEVHERAGRVRLERLEEAAYFDRLRRAQEAAGSDLLGMLQQVLAFLRLLCELGGVLLVVFAVHPSVGSLLVLVFALSMGIRLEADIGVRQQNRELTREGRQADYLREELTQPRTIKELRLYRSMELLIGIWSRSMRRSLALRMNARRREIRRGVLISAIQIAGLFGGIVWLALGLRDGGVTAGILVVTFQAMRQAYGLSASMVFPLSKLYAMGAKLADLAAYLREPPEAEGAGRAGRNAATSLSEPVGGVPGSAGRIVFEDVGFRYAGAAVPALRGIRLTLTPGETVALVGDNGAGKSTLVKLLLGLYRPTSGRITWDGADYHTLNPVRLRQAMAAAFQDFVRYETTLRDNVGFGSPELLQDDARLREALDAGGARSLERLAGGLDGRTGQLAAGGRELSGGQWQRLAIARAALRDSPLLVLDEPTAALDPEQETELFRSFRSLAAGRTVLVVAHRLGWARFADRIVVLREGEIVEQGDHETLLIANGPYAAMFRAQAEWYRQEAPPAASAGGGSTA